MTPHDDTAQHNLFTHMLEYKMRNGEIQFAQGKERVMKERVIRLQSYAYRVHINLSTEPSLTSGSSNARTETQNMTQRPPATPPNMLTLPSDQVSGTTSMVVHEKAINQATPFMSDTIDSAGQQLLNQSMASTSFGIPHLSSNAGVPGQFSSDYFLNGTEDTSSAAYWNTFSTQSPNHDPTANYMTDNFNGQAH